MTTEEENLYQFLGEESNFENALLVIKHMPGMRNFLLDRFWKGVMKQVEILGAKGLENWRLLELNHQKQYWCLHLYKTTWPDKIQNNNLSIRWAELDRIPQFGVWVRKESECLDWVPFRDGVASLRERFCEIQPALKIQASVIPDWWPILYKTKLDFAGFKGLKPILPANRETLATLYAQLMIDLVEAVDEPLEQLIKQYSK
jgi:hypothetical protein